MYKLRKKEEMSSVLLRKEILNKLVDRYMTRGSDPLNS
jgi:hypothetical protein